LRDHSAGGVALLWPARRAEGVAGADGDSRGCIATRADPLGLAWPRINHRSDAVPPPEQRRASPSPAKAADMAAADKDCHVPAKVIMAAKQPDFRR
jgi:hypothetical protein